MIKLLIDRCFCFLLREHFPLKQGLRPHMVPDKPHHPRVLREYFPLKQGLRHVTFVMTAAIQTILREHFPLKQGLRLCPFTVPDEYRSRL